MLNVFQFCSVNKLQKSNLPSQKCKSYSTDTYRYIKLAMQSWIRSHVSHLCSTCAEKYQPAPFLLGHLIQLSLNTTHAIALSLQQRVVLCILHVHSSFGDSTLRWQNMIFLLFGAQPAPVSLLYWVFMICCGHRFLFDNNKGSHDGLSRDGLSRDGLTLLVLSYRIQHMKDNPAVRDS